MLPPSLSGPPAPSSGRPGWRGVRRPGRRVSGEGRPTAATPPPLSLRPFPPPTPGALLELPHQHRIPLTWLLENAGASIRYRTLTELAPAGYVTPEAREAAHQGVCESKAALAVVKKQKDSGTWGGNLLGLAPSVAQGIKDVGTIPNYRRLLQLEWPRTG